MTVSDELLDRLERLSQAGDAPPWKSWVEGRDHMSGDSFIQVGAEEARQDDMYVSRDSGPAANVDLDLIAAARTYLPVLIAEIRALRAAGGDSLS